MTKQSFTVSSGFLSKKRKKQKLKKRKAKTIQFFKMFSYTCVIRYGATYHIHTHLDKANKIFRAYSDLNISNAHHCVSSFKDKHIHTHTHCSPSQNNIFTMSKVPNKWIHCAESNRHLQYSQQNTQTHREKCENYSSGWCHTHIHPKRD